MSVFALWSKGRWVPGCTEVKRRLQTHQQLLPVLPSQAQTGRCLQSFHHSSLSQSYVMEKLSRLSVNILMHDWGSSYFKLQLLLTVFYIQHISVAKSFNGKWFERPSDVTLRINLSPSNPGLSLAYSSHYHEPCILLIVRRTVIWAQHWPGTVFIPDYASPQAK